jgi:Ser/Thr protein kinase RdoA (MazF antagonist)
MLSNSHHNSPAPDHSRITDLHAPRTVPAVSADDVVRVLDSAYGLTATRHPQPLDSYWDYNFKVHTNIGNLFCKAYTHDQFEDARFHADVITKLSREGLLVPRLIPSRGGHPVCEINGLPFIVQRFLPGEVLANTELTPKLNHELGRTLAQIHNILEGRIVTGNKTKISSWDPRQHQLLFTRYEGALSLFSPRARKALDTVQVKTEALYPELRELPVGIAHGDYHPGNILVAHNTVAGVLDFNEAIESWHCGDIGIALSYLIQGEKDPIEIAKNFLNGYRAERDLTVYERVFIPLMIQLRACTRAIESKLAGGSASKSDINLIEYLNDPTTARAWTNFLL